LIGRRNHMNKDFFHILMHCLGRVKIIFLLTGYF